MTDFRNGVLYYRGTAADDIAATDTSAPWIHKSRDAWWCLCCHKGADNTHLESGPHEKWIGSYGDQPEKWRCQEIPTQALDAHYLPKICDCLICCGASRCHGQWAAQQAMDHVSSSSVPLPPPTAPPAQPPPLPSSPPPPPPQLPSSSSNPWEDMTEGSCPEAYSGPSGWSKPGWSGSSWRKSSSKPRWGHGNTNRNKGKHDEEARPRDNGPGTSLHEIVAIVAMRLDRLESHVGLLPHIGMAATPSDPDVMSELGEELIDV